MYYIVILAYLAEKVKGNEAEKAITTKVVTAFLITIFIRIHTVLFADFPKGFYRKQYARQIQRELALSVAIPWDFCRMELQTKA